MSKINIFLTLFIVAVLLGGCLKADTSAMSNEAMAMIETGQIKSADTILDNVIKRNPNDGPALAAKAWTCSRENRYEQAIELQEKAILADKNNAKTRIFSADLFIILGENERAQQECMRAEELDPEQKASFLVKTESLIRRGQVERAKEEIETLLQTNADNRYLLCAMGNIQAKRKHYADALEYYQKSRQNLSDFAPAILGEAIVLSKQGKLEEAKILADKILLDDPNNGPACLVLAEYHHQNKAYEQYKTQLSAAMERDHYNPDILMMQVKTLIANDKQQQALGTLETILKFNPNHGDALCYKGLLFFSGGKRRSGLLLIRKAAQSDPYSSYARAVLAEMYIQQQNPKQALAQAEKAVQIDAGEMLAWRRIALLSLNNKNNGRAKEAIETILRAQPNDGEAIYLKAKLQLAEGKEAESLQTLKTAVEKGVSTQKIKQDTHWKSVSSKPDFKELVEIK